MAEQQRATPRHMGAQHRFDRLVGRPLVGHDDEVVAARFPRVARDNVEVVVQFQQHPRTPVEVVVLCIPAAAVVPRVLHQHGHLGHGARPGHERFGLLDRG